MNRDKLRVLLLLVCTCLAACAHQRVYTLRGVSLEWTPEKRALTVWDIRPSSMGMPRAPVLYLRGASSACFEGFYNPTRTPLHWSEATERIRAVVLCPDPDEAADRGAFRLDVRADSGALDQLPFFAVRSAADAASVGQGERSQETVRLPPDAAPFQDHPELLGALFAVGVLPILPEGDQLLR